MTAPMTFCRSRNDGRRCTRELGHSGLHRHRSIMWTDAGADELRCPDSGAPSAPAPILANGFPEGRAPCPTCVQFVALTPDGRLAEHETWSAASEADRADRAAWFNTFGWAGAPHGTGCL